MSLTLSASYKCSLQSVKISDTLEMQYSVSIPDCHITDCTSKLLYSLYVGMVRTHNIRSTNNQIHVTSLTEAYLNTQPLSLSAFMINKTHTVTQKPRRRQLNTNVCSCESAILLFFLSLFRPL